MAQMKMFESPEVDQDMKFSLHKLPGNDELHSPEPTKEFVKCVQDLGVWMPIILQEDGDGGYKVHAGKRRIKASREVGLDTIPALIYPEGSDISSVIHILDNEMRSPNKNDRVAYIAKCLGEGMTDEEIAREMRVETRMVRHYIKIAKMTPALLFPWLAGRISNTVFNKLANRSLSEQKKYAEHFEQNGQLTLEDARCVQKEIQKEYRAQAPVIFDLPEMEGITYVHKAESMGDGIKVLVQTDGQERELQFTINELLALRAG